MYIKYNKLGGEKEKMENKKNLKKSITVIAVVLSVLAVAMVGTASAKSAYVVASWDTNPNPINAYDIVGNNLVYQVTNTVPHHGAGAMGITIDTDSKTLFVSYEASNIIEKIDATTFAVLGSQTATGASNGAGIVVDEPKGLVYWIDRGTRNLFIYDVATFTLQSSPTLPSGNGGWGLALDGNRLFVGDFTNTVRYYDTTSWAELGSVTLSSPAVGVAVDSKNGFLYAGSYTGSNKLMKCDLTTGDESSVNVGTNVQVRGLAVDQATGLLYITSGVAWSNSGKVEVYDSNLNFLSSNIINDNPTGICVPIEEISYNPLQLSKDDGLGGACVDPGASLTYTICYDNTLNNYDVHNVEISDPIPAQTSFASATGGGTHDPATNTVTWSIGTLLAGATQQCVQLEVNVDATATLGSSITNSATINSDETAQTTVNEQTDVCQPGEKGNCCACPAGTPDGCACTCMQVADENDCVINHKGIWVDTDGCDIGTNEPCDEYTCEGGECIPEFSTIALPVASIRGLLFFFYSHDYCLLLQNSFSIRGLRRL